MIDCDAVFRDEEYLPICCMLDRNEWVEADPLRLCTMQLRSRRTVAVKIGAARSRCLLVLSENIQDITDVREPIDRRDMKQEVRK